MFSLCVYRLCLRLREVCLLPVTQLWTTLSLLKEHVPVSLHTFAYIYTNTNCCIIDCLNILSTACVSGCDFDTLGDLCGWMTETGNPDVFGFDQWVGPTETEGTGPDDDFSKPGCKWFFFYCSSLHVTKPARMVL